MRILGIDPGTGRMGWAIIEKEGGKEKLLECGCLETKAHTPVLVRLRKIFELINELVDKYGPTEAGVEDLFFYNNAKTAMTVGQARGVILVALTLRDVAVFDYTPLQIKAAVTGYGQADKKQVQKMVKMILGLAEVPKPDDAADAVAAALTHSAARRMVR